MSMTAALALTTNAILPTVGLSYLGSLGPSTTLILSSLTSYAIVKHRLLDIEVIIRRSLVYSTLLAILIGIYSLLVSILNRVFLPGTAAGAFPRVTDLIAIVLVAFTVDPLRRYIEKATDKIFFKARYNAEEIINQLSETLVSEIDLIQLAREIKKVLTESIKVSKVSIYVKSDHRLFAIAAANDFPKRLDTSLEKLHFVTQYLAKHPDILVMEELERMAKEGKRLDHHLTEAIKSFDKIGVEVVVPLLVKGRLNGAMFLGERLSQDIYSGADLRFLEILSHQAALSLENAKLYEEQKLYGVRLTKEVERATTDLRDANERLKELDELKDEFMSIASHELRTPMTAIKSYVWLALNNKGGEITTKLRNYLTKVYDSSDRMIAMINDMLNVSRIETGKLQLEIVPVSIQKVLDQVTGDLSARSAEAGVEIKVAKDQIIPLVLADREKLAEIFTNLIGNALKFTRRGGKVTVSAQKAGNMVEVSVTDTGVGIAKEDIPKLFKKYGRIGESYATMTPSTGTGLGLYITKQYLEKMHGNISVKSTLGKGTTFSFSLPIATGVIKETEEKKEVVPFVPKSIIR
jgi:signal transduction histidine kinase